MATSPAEMVRLDDRLSGGTPATTTISTIAVQSGNTRIVIALLQSKEWIQLKIQEMHPAMTDIGADLQEVTDLYQQHEKVLEKLQTKQSPVEELLRQADDLISTQKPRGEVYSAMAENLGLAWKDLNAQLEQRRQILEQAVAFFTRSQQFSDSLDVIQKSVSETFLPNTVESTTSILNRIKEERKAALANSMRLLNEGQLLLERLCEVATHSMGDSRPLHMQHAARNTAAFVERHMEALQDRWRHLEALWNQKKKQLEQCLLRCQLDLKLTEVEDWLHMRGTDFISQQNLGDSLASSEILLHEHQKNLAECKEMQENCLKLVKTSEDLYRQGNYAADELRNKSYLLLSECAELLAGMEQRRQLLVDAVSFFSKAQTALTKLDQIEIQLSTSGSTVLRSTVDEIVKDAVQEGRQILNTTGITDPGAQGISKKLDELERTLKKLDELCKSRESVASEKSAAFNKFCEKYDELMKWWSNNGDFFVQRTRNMGTTQTSVKSFLDQHETLQNDLRTKGMEVDALLRTVPNLVRSGGSEAEVVHSKSDHLRQLWSQLRTTLEKRILIAQKYLSFLKLSTKVFKDMDELESLVHEAVAVPDQSKFRNIEEKQFTLRTETAQLNNNGKNFLQDIQKVDDMYLDTTQPCTTVEVILNRLELRNVSLNTQWLNLQNEISATKETLVQWDQLLKDTQRVLKNAQEFDKKLFPVIPYELNRVQSILPFLEKQMSVVLPQVKSIQKEIEEVLRKSEAVKPKDSAKGENARVIQNLKDINQSLQKKLTDYQILISMMIAFFKNFEELEKLVDMQESQFRMSSLPSDVSKLESLIRDHDASKPTVMELFKFSNTEAQQLINKINEAEPLESAAKDREKIASVQSARKLAFEKAWDDYKYKIDQQNQLCVFFRDMHLINKQIEDLNSQLSIIQRSYGECLPSALHTSQAFLQFEKTIEILQVRIHEFVSTAERMMRDHRVNSNQVHGELETMQKKWSTFRTEVNNNRLLIDVSIEYYKTVEEAEEWLKEGSRLLISIARKSSGCTKESDAEALQKEIRDFITTGQAKQDERLRKISTLSQQLPGNKTYPLSNTVTTKNKDMMNSFSIITSELHTMTTNIKLVQQTKMADQKGKEEMDAVLHAAHAEAESARAAAVAALQAAKAAEAVAKSIPVQRPPRFLRHLMNSEVPEGTKFTFECEVEGEPTPQAQWYKDGILVENNPDYQTSFDKGICKLTIEETFSEDTAKFVCRATNSAGVAETQSQLVVKEFRTSTELIPPHFVQEPLDSVVVEGDSHLLECQVFGNPLPLVSWFKDDTCIDYSTEYSITYNNGYCSLKIDEAALGHQGRYTCRAVNPVGQVACSANLQVKTTSSSEGPRFVSPLSNVMARAGQKLRLECSIIGQPQPEVSWLHNSKPIKETRDTKLHFDGCNATLVITEAFPKDAGTYTIVARNKAGETVSSCNVSVKGRLPLETSDSEIASDIEPAKPQVKLQLGDQSVAEGVKVRMDCIIVGQPEPEVIWYHNGKPVKESDDFQLLFEGDRCTLIIEEAYLEDSGTYKCVAINSGGEASSACQLTVQPMTVVKETKSEFIQRDILLTMESCDSPKFLRLLENVFVTEGETILLECQYAGGEDTTLNWLKEGLKITSTPDCQITSDSPGLSRLTIPVAKVSDRGTYSAKLQSKSGGAQSICSVSVAAPLKFGQTPAEVAPNFIQHVANQTLPVGGTARFDAFVEGSPKPKVRWNFKGKPVPIDNHYEVGLDGDKKHWLLVREVEKGHEGRYSAIAENNTGIATTSALLTVEVPFSTKPAPVAEYQAQSMIMKRKAVVQTSTISSMSEVSDSDYQPAEFPSFSSLQSQHLVKTEQSSFSQQPVPSYLPQRPQPAIPLPPQQDLVAPKYIQQPETVSSTEIKKTSWVSTDVQRSTSIPPKFVRPVSTAVVTEGEKLLLEAQYEGVPEPGILWFKDEKELKNRPGLQISAPGGKYTSLYILKSVESDSGSYSCIASNCAGKATSIAEVKVKPYREAPKFKKRPPSSVVKSGTKLTLEVEVTGVPKPDVKWHRNGNLLKDSPDFRISSIGNSHTLIIAEVFPEDSGTFTVVASNAAGEARSQSELIVEEDKTPEEEKTVTYQEFTSLQQTKQTFTKISTNEVPFLQPYQNEPETKAIAAPPQVEKVPSPPPMSVASVKVWTQPKPESLTTAITEVQEPILIPSPEPEETAPEEQAQIQTVFDSKFPLMRQTQEEQAPVSIATSESFVKQSIMKFSKPDVQTEHPKVKSVPSAPPTTTVMQNGHDKGFPPFDSFTNVGQSTFISESKSISTSGHFYSTDTSNVPKLSFVPKTSIPDSVISIQRDHPVLSPQVEQGRETTFAPESVNTVFNNLLDSRLPTTCDTGSNVDASDFRSTSTTSCQTSTIPNFYTTESSTTTKTSFSKEEISITKKYEYVVEHSSDVVSSSDEASKIVPKPIIKKDVRSGPKPKKEVVIEEEPVVGAEVKPPHFAKVRGSESLRKIYADI